MVETFTSSRGATVTVIIPDMTPERKKERDKEIEQRLVALYKKMVAEGKGSIFNKSNSK